MATVRTRIAPSPTGEDIHIGNLYTALINWAFAKKNNGQFIIRVEDTDRERYIEGSEQRILSSLKNFGLKYDEGPDIGGKFAPYRQSERLEIYKKYSQELIDKDLAYFCFCSKERLEEIRKEEEKTPVKKKHREHCQPNPESARQKIAAGEKYVVRLKVPEHQDVVFEDLIRGKIVINTDQVDDQVLMKSDGYPTYHLAVVVDDHLMEISYVIRAEEWISSTPKHILLYQAFGWELPTFVHVPILRNPDKSKMSKRKNPVWASWYLEQGYLPQAILNYLALMGWSHPEEKEKFSLEEFIQKLDLKKISPVGPVFDLVKLEWLNGMYIRDMSDEELSQKLITFLGDGIDPEKVSKLVPLVKERIKKLSDFVSMTEFIFKEPQYNNEVMQGLKIPDPVSVLKQVQEKMVSLNKPWQKQEFENTFQQLAKDLDLNNTQMFQLLRIAISGKTVTPPLFESIQILGEEESTRRIQTTISFLNQ